MTQIEKVYSAFRLSGRVSINSQTIRPGDIFFGLPGQKFDGSEFAFDAIEKEAAFAVVGPSFKHPDPRIISVDNPLAFLQELARFHRRQFSIPLIAITGSNGKTTTKELVHAVLSQRFRVQTTAGNLNNHIGVPLSLLAISDQTECAVIEMGANHPGEIDFLCNIAEPDYGLITSLGKAHLEGFGSFEGVVQTKTELFRFLEKNRGMAFFPSDNPLLETHSRKLDRRSYGRNSDDFVRGRNIPMGPFLQFEWKTRDSEWTMVKTRLIGDYNFNNALAALCIGHHFCVDQQLSARAIEAYQPGNNRSQYLISQHNRIILDAYNANPTSMEAALRAFSNQEETKKAAILGDMLELGESGPREHMGILTILQTMTLQEVFLVGEQFLSLDVPPEFRVFRDTNSLARFLESNPLKDRTILMKGSRGIALEKLLPLL